MSLNNLVTGLLLAGGIVALAPAAVAKEEAKDASSLRPLTKIIIQATDKKYDYNPFFVGTQEIDDMFDSCYEIHVAHKYKVDYFNEKGEKTETKEQYLNGLGSSVGLKIKDDQLYLMTAGHVVNPVNKAVVFTDEKTDKVVAVGEYLESKYSLFIKPVKEPLYGMQVGEIGIDLELLADDSDVDVALLRTTPQSKGIRKYKTYNQFGKSDELKPGNWVYIVGFPNGVSKQLCEGIFKGYDNPHYDVDDNINHASPTVHPGNSGGPMYALRDGVPELVGITRSTYGAQDSGIVKIDLIRSFLMKKGYKWLLR